MKSIRWMILWLFLLPSLSSFVIGPKPEKIHSITKIVYPVAYYQEQMGLWKKEIDKNEQDANAWMNYYFACRMSNLLKPTGTENPYDLAAIISQIEKAIPDSYEYHYLAYANEGFNPDNFFHLERAYEMTPERSEVYLSMLTYYEVMRHQDKARFFAKKLMEKGEYSASTMNWNYNVLMSLEENAILLTYGDNDTYPLWLMQYERNIRPDVTVINIHLLNIDHYRTNILQENNIPSFATEAELAVDKKKLVDHLLKKSNRPVYLGVTLRGDIRQAHSSNLYLTGLALKYSETEFDNVAVLKNNVEEKFLMDYLKVDFSTDLSAAVMDHMNANYIPAFILLYKHYEKENQLDKANAMKGLLKKLAAAAGMEDKVMSYFEQQLQPTVRFESIIPVRSLERNFKAVRKNLHAAQTELTIEAYDLFLMDLLKQKEYDKLDQCRPEKSNWRDLAKERLQGRTEIINTEDQKTSLPKVDYNVLSDKMLFRHLHPDEARAPVQNISYEAAQLYCDWITQVYNQSNSKKKKYKKVVFRLPTEEEWEYAASSGQNGRIYPWGTQKITNQKGCFLSNFNASGEPCRNQAQMAAGNDGAFFPVAADAYLENEFGLYNVSGNVAEMILEKGKAKGGSWAATAEACKIKASQRYQQADPTIGFRVFMEIIK